MLTRLLQIPIIPTPSHQNLLARRFFFIKPNKAWVGDITYRRRLALCAIVKDLCTKQIGYAFSEHIDSNLTLAALNMAVFRHCPPCRSHFHSDRGVQYAANAYRQRLLGLHFRQSMSRKGDLYDNAVAENFSNASVSTYAISPPENLL